MAKKTKAADLSIEEKLEQALVVPGYEPYKIPDNWCWIHWRNCGCFFAGSAFKEKYQGLTGLEIPFYKVGSLKESDSKGLLYNSINTIDEEIRNLLKATLIPKYSILFAKIGEAIKLNRRAINNKPCCIDNNLMSFVTNDNCYYKYVFYWSLTIDLYQYTNATTVPAIRKTDLESIPFPLAPLSEQHRIVERIESLFSKLDEAKEKAQEVIDSFEARKAAILHKAFSGELTAKWREENGVGIESWERKTLGEVCNSIFDGDHMPPPKSESGIPFLVISNVNDKYLSFENTRFVPQEYYDAITDTRKPEKGDVLYTLVGSFGIPVVVDTNAPFCFQRHMALLKPKSINTYFLWYLLQSQEMYQKASSIAKGVAQLTVPIKGLRLMDFNCPSEEEQIEIVRILDSLLEKEDTSKDNAESIIDQIDTMKRAILARAFRGELGTNDPGEESAVGLIKEILAEDNTEEKPQKARRTRVVIPKEIDSLLKTELERKIVKLFSKSASKEIDISEIMNVSSNKLDIINTIRALENKQLIKKSDSNKYILVG